MSRIQLCGEQKSPCGYCKCNDSSSYGVVANSLLPVDYEALMYRGFRRSGTYVYKLVPHKVDSDLFNNSLDLLSSISY